MTHDDIRAAITASASLLALVPDTQAIAEALSIGRTKPSGYKVGKGDVVNTIGLPDANIALDAVDSSHEFRHVKHLLPDGRMDADSPTFVEACARLVAVDALTQANADKLLALGFAPDPVSEFDVRCAIYADDGSLMV